MPAETIVIENPFTVQTLVVVDVSTGVNPEVADGDAVMVDAEKVCCAIDGKVID